MTDNLKELIQKRTELLAQKNAGQLTKTHLIRQVRREMANIKRLASVK